jgi:metallo-beta-lactamase family protein
MELANILLADSARIQEQDVEYSNKHRKRKGLPLLQALYTEEQAMECLRLFKIVDYNEVYEITPRAKLKFTDAGHLVGSAAVHLSILEDGKNTQITFSGDVGRYGDMLLKSPQPFAQADYILLDSTYGDSLHKDTGAIEDALLEVIKQTCEIKRGKLIIPAFSVGRTQEVNSQPFIFDKRIKENEAIQHTR